MLTRILCFFLISCSLAGYSQQCSLTTVYFDFNKSDLKKAEAKKLDALLKAVDTNRYYIELSGNTDSVNTEEFNLKLAEARIKTVQTYLTKRKKPSLIYKQFNHGESKPALPNDSEENMAKNRRVDIYLLSPSGDKLVFTAEANESIEIPADFPGTSCSVCETVKYSFLNNDKEAKDAGITMRSGSRDVTTAGMAQFSIDCPEKSTACLPVKITLPFSGRLRTECLSAATLGGRSGSWEKSTATFQLDRATNTIVVTDACYKMRGWAAINKPVDDQCKHQFNFPTDIQVLKTKVSGDSTFFTEQGQMPLTLKCGGSNNLFSWATAEKKHFYLKGGWRGMAPKSENTGNCDTLFTYNLTKESYTAVPVSDTTVYIKFKGFETVKSPSYYIEELDLALPLENYKKTTYTANYLNYPHTVRFEDDKVYNIKYTDVKTKYKKGKKKLKVTVKKKSLLVVS